jgi:dolichol-phosphate mannosyltransferase
MTASTSRSPSPAAPPAAPSSATRSAGPSSAVAAIVCYNNGASAARTLERVPASGDRDFGVVVVDDGSTDDTPTQIARFDFPVVRHPCNRGVGAAIKSGMRHALDNGYDIFCILAGNAKDDPREIHRLLAPIRARRADYVQGSRFASGAGPTNTPLARRVMVRLHARLLRALTGFPGTDALNGFRAYRTAVFGEGGIDVWQRWLDGYELETYLHYKVLTSGRPIAEVGVSKTYPARRAGVRYSHIRPLVDWWRILRPIPLLILGLKE